MYKNFIINLIPSKKKHAQYEWNVQIDVQWGAICALLVRMYTPLYRWRDVPLHYVREEHVPLLYVWRRSQGIYMQALPRLSGNVWRGKLE